MLQLSMDIASNSSSDFVLEVGTNDKDMLFKGQDGGASVTALTLDMSDGGKAIFGANIGMGTDAQIANTAGYLQLRAEDTMYLDYDSDGGGGESFVVMKKRFLLHV